MNTFEKLERLTELAKKDELYPGELLAVGEEYSDNQCKSTNGGNPTPYDSFNDAYEIFLASVEI